LIHTQLKPEWEIQQLLDGVRSIFFLRCGTCSAASGTGTLTTFRRLKSYMEEHGVRVNGQSMVVAACSLAMLGYKLHQQRRRIAQSDAIGMLSCAAGIKSAHLVLPTHAPGKRIVPFCDTLGVAVFGAEAEIKAQTSLCASCSECVLGFTDGVCPQAECPRNLRRPCKKVDALEPTCVDDESLPCVFYTLQQRGNLDALLTFELARKQRERTPIFPTRPHSRPSFRDKTALYLCRHGGGWDTRMEWMS
jgi:hypothetical protein